MQRGIGVFSVSLCALACGSRSPSFEKAPVLMPASAIDDHLVLVDSARNEARLLDVSGAAAPAAPTVVPLTANPTLLQARNGHTNEILVLSAGQPDGTAAPAESPGLSVIDSSGKKTLYPFSSSSAFNTMTQSDDGRYVFFFYDSSQGPPPNEVVALTPNHFSLVDLDQGTVFSDTLQGYAEGETPRAVAFSTSDVPVPSAPRRLAVVMFDSSIEIFDLSHLDLDRPRFTVQFTAGIELSRVVFSSTEPKMYFLANGSNDVFVVTLGPASGATTTSDGGALNDFTPSMNLLPAGTNPSDIALYSDGTATRLLAVAPGSQQVIVIDADSSTTTTVPLPVQESKILLYQGPSPNDSTVQERALLYSLGTSVMTFLDLVGLESPGRGQLAVDPLTIQQPYTSVTPLEQTGQRNVVMFVQQEAGLSLVDLNQRTVTPVIGPNLSSAIDDPIAQKLWLAPPGGEDVAYLDLVNGLQPNQLHLDAAIDQLVPVTSSSHPKVVITHPASMGYATVLDANAPSLTSAFAMRGYLFQGALGSGQ